MILEYPILDLKRRSPTLCQILQGTFTDIWSQTSKYWKSASAKTYSELCARCPYPCKGLCTEMSNVHVMFLSHFRIWLCVLICGRRYGHVQIHVHVYGQFMFIEHKHEHERVAWPRTWNDPPILGYSDVRMDLNTDIMSDSCCPPMAMGWGGGGESYTVLYLVYEVSSRPKRNRPMSLLGRGWGWGAKSK